MSEDRRQRLCYVAACLVLVFGHGGLLVGLALIGEWRVWRFITNAIAQLDAGLLIGWMAWASLTSLRARWHGQVT
jgi:hypothetical protein